MLHCTARLSPAHARRVLSSPLLLSSLVIIPTRYTVSTHVVVPVTRCRRERERKSAVWKRLIFSYTYIAVSDHHARHDTLFRGTQKKGMKTKNERRVASRRVAKKDTLPFTSPIDPHARRTVLSIPPDRIVAFSATPPLSPAERAPDSLWDSSPPAVMFPPVTGLGT